jgi:hypothetical protein
VKVFFAGKVKDLQKFLAHVAKAFEAGAREVSYKVGSSRGVARR